MKKMIERDLLCLYESLVKELSSRLDAQYNIVSILRSINSRWAGWDYDLSKSQADLIDFRDGLERVEKMLNEIKTIQEEINERTT